MKEPSAEKDEIARQVVDAAIVVHKELGPGLLESVYEICLMDVLQRRGLDVVSQVPIPVLFQERRLEAGFRADLIVENKVLIEIKSVEKLAGIHEAQILTYLKLSKMELGFLLNFNASLMKEGIRRFARSAPSDLASLASWR